MTSNQIVTKWTRKLIVGPVFIAGLLAFTAASASDVFVSETGLGAGQASGFLVLPVGTNDFWTGQQTIAVKANLADATATSFVAYCIYPYTANYSTSGYTAFYPSPVNTLYVPQAPTIQKLFNAYYAGTINNVANAAAFQLALWEVANDDGNLSTGTVRINSSTDAGLVSNTTTLLNNLSHSSYSGPNLYDLTVYVADRAVPGALSGQNYIVATPSSSSNPADNIASPVPEPESYGLILAGLGMMGFILRPSRRRSI